MRKPEKAKAHLKPKAAIAACYRQLDVEQLGSVPLVDFWRLFKELSGSATTAGPFAVTMRNLGLTVAKRRGQRGRFVTWNQKAAAFCEKWGC